MQWAKLVQAAAVFFCVFSRNLPETCPDVERGLCRGPAFWFGWFGGGV